MTTNKQIAEIFKLAKTHLMGAGGCGRKVYICHAIEQAAYMGNLYYAGVSARAIIQGRLGRIHVKTHGVEEWVDLTVTQYLREVLKINPLLLTIDNLQAYRHRWLDSLILEFSK